MKKKTLLLGTLLSLSLGLFAQSPLNETSFEEYMQKRLSSERTPGISVAVLNDDWSTTFKGFGSVTLQTQTDITPNTLYEIGSITKSFTGLLVQILINQKDISVHTPISDILGEGYSIPDFNGTKITLAHLLAHTSALPRLPGNMAPATMDDPYKEYTYEQLFQFLAGLTLTREPGSQFEYSNLAYMLLGYLCEKMGGAPYDQLIEVHITSQLDMLYTSRTAPSYRQHAVPTNEGKLVGYWTMDHTRGFGELRSSASDMINLMKAGAFRKRYQHDYAFFASRVPQISLRDDRHVALGWFLATTETDTIIYHGGGTGGFRTFAGYSYTTGRAAVVLANSNDDVQDIGLHLINSDFPLRTVPDEITLSEAEINRLVGRYTHPSVPSFTVIYQDGSLQARMDGQPFLRLTTLSPTVFENRTVGAQIKFDLNDEATAAVTLTLLQGMNEIQFERDFSYIPTTYEEEKPMGPLTEIELPLEVLKEYEGVYNSPLGLSYEFTLSGTNLMAKLTNQPSIQVFPHAKDKFFYRIVEARMEFTRNESGTVTGVTLFQGGQQLEFQKSQN